MNAGRELEVCVDTLQGCEAASASGADRIELCAALEVGGVTPSRALIVAALATATVPVHVLIRPRSGDFFYTAAEFDMLCADAEDALTLGAAGIVTGVLTESGEIDAERMGRIMTVADGHPVTFHRAFDRARDLPTSLESVIGLGCSRILTSGGEPTVTVGLESLAALAAQASGRIRIAAGGGVNLGIAPRLCRIQGLDLHGSFRGQGGKSVVAGGDPLWNDDRAQQYVNPDTIRALRAVMQAEAQETQEAKGNVDDSTQRQ